MPKCHCKHDEDSESNEDENASFSRSFREKLREQLKAVLAMRIEDIEKARRIEQPYVHYLHKSKALKTVRITGNIIDTGFHKDDIRIDVSDGSGVIKCIIKDKECTYLKSPAGREKSQRLTPHEELIIGTKVKVLGNLSDFYGSKIIYVRNVTVLEKNNFTSVKRKSEPSSPGTSKLFRYSSPSTSKGKRHD